MNKRRTKLIERPRYRTKLLEKTGVTVATIIGPNNYSDWYTPDTSLYPALAKKGKTIKDVIVLYGGDGVAYELFTWCPTYGWILRAGIASINVRVSRVIEESENTDPDVSWKEGMIDMIRVTEHTIWHTAMHLAIDVFKNNLGISPIAFTREMKKVFAIYDPSKEVPNEATHKTN